MKATGEADRQSTATKGAFKHAHQIEVTEQRHGAGLGELNPQTTDPFTGGGLRRDLLRNIGSRNHDVVAEVGAAHTTTGAAIKGAVRNNRRLERTLKVLSQPALIDARIDVVPGEGLSAEGLEVVAVQSSNGTPSPQLHRAITALKTGLGNRPRPGRVGAVKGLEPRIHPGTSPPGGFDHRGQPAVTTPDEIFHRGEADIGEIHLQTTQALERSSEQVLPSQKLCRGHAVPLERRVRLRREVADGDVEIESPKIPAALLQHHAGVRDAEHIGVRLPRQTDHEIQLDLAIAVLHGCTNAMEQVVIRKPFVDDVPQPLGPGLRREGQSGLAGSPEDVGNVVIKAIDPLTGQLEGDVLIRQAIAQLHTDRGQGQVVAATQ